MSALIPQPARIIAKRTETPDTQTFTVTGEKGKPFGHLPGQCAMLSLPGVGEAMFSISSSPTQADGYEFSIKAVGKLTHALHALPVGATVLMRGAHGRPFPVEDELRGKDLLFVAGGIGIAPLRSVIKYVFDHRPHFGAVDIVYGARSAADLVFREEMQREWAAQPNTRVHLTIDRAEGGWGGNVGFVPVFLQDLQLRRGDHRVLVCGPPVMITYTLDTLLARSFTKQQVYTTLEMRMKCGVGQCGRCNIGQKYICADGPVFRADELDALPKEM